MLKFIHVLTVILGVTVIYTLAAPQYRQVHPVEDQFRKQKDLQADDPSPPQIVYFMQQQSPTVSEFQ